MAELRQNTWSLDQWYDQAVAGTTGGYESNMLSLYSWGYNTNGQLGVNNKTNYSSPVQVGSDTTWSFVGGGTEGSSIAIKNDGTLWTWSKASYGATGHNNTTTYSSPKQVPGTWSEVAGQQQGMTATKTDGTLWTWGQNSDGQLGQNEGSLFNTHRSSPVQVGSDTDWNKPVDCRNKSGAAIKTDGTLWMWGDNSAGILGHNNQTDYSSPVQVPGTWATAVMGRDCSLASNTDGSLWVWGDNNQGQLGINNDDERSSPTQIPGTTWRTVFLGHKSTFATKTDGTLWSWGYGKRSNIGLLGHNSTTYYSSPVQIGSETDWHSNLGGSMFSTFGMRMN